ncbi:branched-chain amino acid ABC transporter permease [Microbacteriaceae bacterium K1510]|nr:branched-chain amino acid ABC transporter permease [Microbacteriaceae bacterium K1510]
MPFLIRLFLRVVIFATAAVALNIVLGFGGLISLMHATFFGIGAYTVAVLAYHDFNAESLFGLPGTSNLAISLPCGVLAAVVFAVLTGGAALRTSGAYFIMITLAFNQMLYYFLVALQKYGGDDGLQILSTPTVGRIELSDRVTIYYLALATLAVVVLLVMRLVDSRFGMVLRGSAQNERRVIVLGIPTLPYKIVALAISGAITGAAGAIWAVGQGFVSPADVSWVRSADFVVMAVLGGLTVAWGPVLGAFAFVVAESVLSGWTVYWQMLFGLLVILSVVYLRGGLIDLWKAVVPPHPWKRS